jgi:hypothetical protein
VADAWAELWLVWRRVISLRSALTSTSGIPVQRSRSCPFRLVCAFLDCCRPPAAPNQVVARSLCCPHSESPLASSRTRALSQSLSRILLLWLILALLTCGPGGLATPLVDYPLVAVDWDRETWPRKVRDT